MWRRLIYWQGSYGYARLYITNYAAQPATVPGTLDNVIASYSNAVIAQVAEGAVTGLSGSPVSSIYPSVTQSAILACVDTALNAFKLSIPAPKASIFEADMVTVTPTVLAAVLAAAVADAVVSPQGNAIQGILSGVLNGPAFPGSSLS